MDKNLHDIEDLFRKALEDNEENPPQNIWGQVEKKLDKNNVISIKKKYDLLKKVALLLVFLLATLSIYVWKFQNKNSLKPNKNLSEINKESKIKNDTLTEASGLTDLKKPVDSSIVKQRNRQEQNTGVSKVIGKTILKEKIINSKKSLNATIAKNLPVAPMPKNKIDHKSLYKARSSNVSEPIFSKSDESKLLVQKKGSMAKNKANEIAETKVPIQIASRQPMIKSLSDAPLGKNLPEIETLNPENTTGIKNIAANIFTTKEFIKNNKLVEITQPTQTGKTIFQKPSTKLLNQSHFFITAFYSPDILFHHFVNNSPGNSNNNFNVPESESHASTLGALIDYTLGKHWGLQSGITLSRSEFELEYDKPETIYAQPDNSGAIQYKLTSPLGDAFVKPSFSNNPAIGDSIFSKSISYNLQYIGVPFVLKYNSTKGRFSLNASGGISANFLIQKQITTELDLGNDNEIATTNKISGLKPLYFNGLAGIGLDYNIYKQFYFSFSPTLRFALSAINRNLSIQSYPNSLGFVLGLKMKL